MLRVPWDDTGTIVGTLILFAVPALVFVATLITGVPDRVLRLVPLFVVAGPALYWVLTRPGDTSERTQGRQASGSSTGSRYDNPVPVDENLELVATNYEQLNDQAKYRDQLLINANYFSLTILAVLANVFLRVGPELRPLIAMLGAVTAYAFWLGTESYKGTRDAINQELRTIEENAYDELTVVSSYDTRDRTPVGARSLSSYLVSVQIVATFLWWAIYLAYGLYLAYDLSLGFA